jgi:hypothetical protein
VSAFFVSGCDGAEIFQAVDGAFDDISAFVSLCIKARWCTASASFPQAVLARILTLGADAPDTSCLNLLPVMASTVSAVYAHGSGTFPGATSTGTWYTNGVKYLPDIGRVAALAGGDEDGQWQAVAIDA